VNPYGIIPSGAPPADLQLARLLYRARGHDTAVKLVHERRVDLVWRKLGVEDDPPWGASDEAELEAINAFLSDECASGSPQEYWHLRYLFPRVRPYRRRFGNSPRTVA
jgi:hypothetical protein